MYSTKYDNIPVDKADESWQEYEGGVYPEVDRSCRKCILIFELNKERFWYAFARFHSAESRNHSKPIEESLLEWSPRGIGAGAISLWDLTSQVVLILFCECPMPTMRMLETWWPKDGNHLTNQYNVCPPRNDHVTCESINILFLKFMWSRQNSQSKAWEIWGKGGRFILAKL